MAYTMITPTQLKLMEINPPVLHHNVHDDGGSSTLSGNTTSTPPEPDTTFTTAELKLMQAILETQFEEGLFQCNWHVVGTKLQLAKAGNSARDAFRILMEKLNIVGGDGAVRLL